MKYRKLFSAVLLISLVCLADTTARTKTRKAAGRANNVEFDLCYDFSIQAIPYRMNFVTVIPKTIPDRQEILEMQFSTKPSRVFSKNGNDYAEFIFTRPKSRFQLKINVKAKLFRYDLSTAQKNIRKILPKKTPT